jgi:hypothetical protein
MSYELVNQSTEICITFSRHFWSKALELATDYGWKPLGTGQPKGFDFYEPIAEWDGRYLTNDGQIVKRVDAFWIADALENSLKDIPNTNPKIDWNSEINQDDLPEWLSPEEQQIVEEEFQNGLLDIMGVNPLEFFAGDEKQRLKVFIRFCRLGSFEIL